MFWINKSKERVIIMTYKKTTFSNGLRVITVPMKGTETVTVTVMVGVGSRYENEKEAGISHFLEHMFFKGTDKRPNALAISEELDSIGGEFNAFTAKDRTSYYTKVDSKHLNTALDVVADMYLNSKIQEEEIQKEKGAVLQELNMYEDTPVRSVSDVFENLLYGENPLGRDIIGYKKTIQSFTRHDFIGFLDRFYLANDTVLCIAGKFNEAYAIDQVKKYFSGMKRGKKGGIEKVIEQQREPRMKIKFKKTDQTHFMIGTRAYDENHKDRFALSLLSVILGGNMSSRLFIEVRERRGLAYYVRTSIDAYEDCGYLATQAGVEHKNLPLAIQTILDEYQKAGSEGVSARELQKSKDFLKGKTVMGMESSDEVAMFFVDQAVRKKRIMTLDEIFNKIDKVSVSDIQRVAREIFRESTINVAVIGPHKDEEGLKKLLHY